MKKVTTASQLKDVRIDKSDFILQHKNTAFTEVYAADMILG